MKRFYTAAAVMAVCLAVAGCNGQTTTDDASNASSSSTEAQAPSTPLEVLIAETQEDFSATSQKLVDEREKLFAEVGSTYDGYVEHVDSIQAWYDLAISETEALGQRAVAYGREYYQAVVDNVDVTDDRSLNRAVEDFYDAVYEDAFEDYYDVIYEDAFEDAYAEFYDGILDDAYDTLPYGEWSDARSDAYDAWSDSRSEVYDVWSDSRSDIYDDYSDVFSAFYNREFDLDAVFGPVEMVDSTTGTEASDAAEGAGETAQTNTDAAATAAADTSEVAPEFKAAMDGYEAFFDEYVEFMKAYQADPTATDLMGRYPDMLSQYTETMASMNDIDTASLSTADYAYYAEVSGRIAQKTAELL